MNEDLISRSALLDKIESTDWYHVNEQGNLQHGANSKLHTAWYKADDIFAALENAPAVDAETFCEQMGLVKEAFDMAKANLVPVDDMLGEMLNWAVRYSLGRMSYAVGDTVSYVMPLIPKLDRRTLSVMQRDIETAPSYGHECDKADWMRLLYAIREELKRRADRE